MLVLPRGLAAIAESFVKSPLAAAEALRDGSVLLSVCSFIRSSVACEICEVIRQVAAPGGERWLIVSDTLVLTTVACCQWCSSLFCNDVQETSV